MYLRWICFGSLSTYIREQKQELKGEKGNDKLNRNRSGEKNRFWISNRSDGGAKGAWPGGVEEAWRRVTLAFLSTRFPLSVVDRLNRFIIEFLQREVLRKGEEWKKCIEILYWWRMKKCIFSILHLHRNLILVKNGKKCIEILYWWRMEKNA
jgi:hypothetical protein